MVKDSVAYPLNPGSTSSPFPWDGNALFGIVNAIGTGPCIFAALMVDPASFATKSDKLGASFDMNTFLGPDDTPSARPLVIALQGQVKRQRIYHDLMFHTFLLSRLQLEHASLALSPPIRGARCVGGGVGERWPGAAVPSRQSICISLHLRHGLPSSHLRRAFLQASHPSTQYSSAYPRFMQPLQGLQIETRARTRQKSINDPSTNQRRCTRATHLPPSHRTLSRLTRHQSRKHAHRAIRENQPTCNLRMPLLMASVIEIKI